MPGKIPFSNYLCKYSLEPAWLIILGYSCHAQIANYLNNVGVMKGDAVVINLPRLLELPIAMSVCARIGAVH